ncbi:MAG TPA: endo-1,4-beta-xylanase [Pirellulales bacterium]|nr:endo-1,4-beta-xylanase [Pirellulales bacterium]
MPNGLMRLIVPPNGRLTPRLAERAYMAGPDQIPWHCRTRLSDGELIIERHVVDSGKFLIPWPVAGHGEVMLSTATLMERDRPYQLLVELARGKVHQVRNQIADWQSIGLVTPPKIEAALHKALGFLSRAVTSQHDPAKAAEFAEKAIVGAFDVSDLLVSSYIDQALAARQRQSPRINALLGASLGPDAPEPPLDGQFLRTFNAAIVPLAWRQVEASEGRYQWEAFDRQIEWCGKHSLAVCAGPLLRLDALGLPDWLYLWEGDFNNVQSFASDYVEAVVSRYRGKAQVWHCASRVNVGEALSLSEEQKLRLAVRAIEIIRDVDPSTPLVVRFDQPWAEYMSRTTPDLSPLHFADALVRAGLQLSGIGLEINMGYYPGGSYPRDRLEFSRLLDLWSCLGLPLQLMISVPGSQQPAPAAKGRPQPIADAFPGGWSPENQAAWIKHYFPLFFAKPAVHGVFWNQLRDGETAEFPYAGLVDSGGNFKPAFTALSGLRRKYLD